MNDSPSHGNQANRQTDSSRSWRYRLLLGLLLSTAILLAGWMGWNAWRTRGVLEPNGPGAAPVEGTSASRPGNTTPDTTVADTPAALQAEELTHARQLLATYPAAPRALNVLGHVYNNHGQRAEAVAQWRKLVALDPNNAAAYDTMAKVAFLKGDHGEAIELWQKTLELAPRMPGIHYQLGTALMGAGRLQEAAVAFNRETELNPRASGPHTLLGEVYRLLGRPDEAIRHFACAVQMDPNAMKACYGLAMAYRTQKNTEPSRQWMSRFQELKAKADQADQDRRSVYDDMNQIRQVTARTLTELASVYAEQGDYDHAEMLWLRASTLDKTQLSCRQNLGQLYHYTQRLDQAIAMCRELAQLEPNHAAYLVNMAVFHSQLDQYDAAIEAMKRAVALDPGKSTHYRFLAKVTLQTSHPAEQAVVYARKALDLEPSAANHFMLGRACEHQGDVPGALAAYQRAAELDPLHAQYASTYRQFRKEQLSESEDP